MMSLGTVKGENLFWLCIVKLRPMCDIIEGGREGRAFLNICKGVIAVCLHPLHDGGEVGSNNGLAVESET